MSVKLVIILFIAVVVGLLPVWPYSLTWGFASSGWILLLGFVIMALRTFRAI